MSRRILVYRAPLLGGPRGSVLEIQVPSSLSRTGIRESFDSIGQVRRRSKFPKPMDTAFRPVWDSPEPSSPWTPLGALPGDVSCDVCVIGLGGTGLSAIWTLLGHGKRVIGLDQSDVGAGAAGSNGGFLLAGIAAFHHDAVKKIGNGRARRLYVETMKELDSIFARHPVSTRRVGSLRIAESEEEWEDCLEQLNEMKKDGLPVELYDGEEGHGLQIPTDGVMNPLRRCRELAKDCVAKGARLYGRTKVLAVESTEEQVTIRTDRGTITANQTIVAVDALQLVLPELADRVKSVRLQMVSTSPLPDIRWTRPVYFRFGYEYFQQLPDRRLALGGFRDKGGDDEWTIDRSPSAIVQSHLDSFLRKRLSISEAIDRRWAATVGYTDSGLPFADQVQPSVWALGGYCGTGNVVGSILGREVADALVLGHRASTPFLDAVRGREKAKI